VTRDHSINDKSTPQDKSFRSSVDERMRGGGILLNMRDRGRVSLKLGRNSNLDCRYRQV
jgi:hypothetical protein